MAAKFKVGDKVRRIEDVYKEFPCTSGEIVTVIGVDRDGDPIFSEDDGGEGWASENYELVAPNPNRHKHYDVIVAWVNGVPIQYNYNGWGWRDFSMNAVALRMFDNDEIDWRIKPKTVTKRFRMALHSNNSVAAYDVTNSCIDDPIEHQIKGFVKWIGETASVEI